MPKKHVLIKSLEWDEKRRRVYINFPLVDELKKFQGKDVKGVMYITVKQKIMDSKGLMIDIIDVKDIQSFDMGFIVPDKKEVEK